MVMPFSQILELYMPTDRGSAARKLSEKTVVSGVIVSKRNIQRYLKSQNVPNFKFAKSLINALEISMDDDEIMQSIELEKEKQMAKRASNVKTKQKVMINFENAGSWDATALYEESLRIANLRYPEETHPYNKYILELIVKDVERNIRNGK